MFLPETGARREIFVRSEMIMMASSWSPGHLLTGLETSN